MDIQIETKIKILISFIVFLIFIFGNNNLLLLSSIYVIIFTLWLFR